MSSPVQPGDVLASKYRVERVLGVGGMGVVVAATHLQLDQQVALKFMLPEVLGNATAVTRFLREAKAVVKLKSEHVARVLDVGTLDNGAPYIVMEYLEGSDLSGVLEKHGPLAPGDAATYLLQACEAMAEAHALGIVHRDLKPQNLFLTHTADGSSLVKVLDFGISKAGFADATGVRATQTHTMMGSPAYMSPEQVNSAKDVDHRTDIWAIGVILYELVSGHLPFNGERMVELCMQVLSSEPAPLRQLRPDLPAELEAVVARCLRKNPGERYANIAELVADLVRFVPTGVQTLERVSRVLKVPARPSSDPGISIPPAVQTAASLSGAPPVKPFAATTPALVVETTLGGAAGVSIPEVHRPSRGGRIVALGAGVAIAAGLFVFLLLHHSGHSQQGPADAAASAVASQGPAIGHASPPPDAAVRPPDAAQVAASIDAGAPATVAVPHEPPPATTTKSTAITKPATTTTTTHKRDPFATRH